MESKSTYKHYTLEGYKMLIIDDDEGLSKSIKFYFEDHECEVYTANDGNAGIQMIDAIKPDIVLVDLNMPRVSGHSVVSHVSRNYVDMPVIVISGTGLIKDAVRAINLGAWDFIAKPILNFEELELSVLRAFEKIFLQKENENYKRNLEKLVEERTEALESKSHQLQKLVEELNEAKEKAEASDRLKSEFLAQMSHEIRTPVNVIMSYGSMLGAEFDELEHDEIVSGIDVIKNAGKRLIRTVELILNMSELEIGSFKVNPTEVDLAGVIENVIYDYKLLNSNKNLEINFKSEVNNSLIKTDNHSITQILSNIIDNAVKYTKQGEVLVKLKEDSQLLKIVVEDTGIGISEEYLPKIFTPFSQEEQGYTRSYEGNGLGLSLVKKYCDLNGIAISISSKKHSGTKIELNFSKK